MPRKEKSKNNSHWGKLILLIRRDLLVQVITNIHTSVQSQLAPHPWELIASPVPHQKQNTLLECVKLARLQSIPNEVWYVYVRVLFHPQTSTKAKVNEKCIWIRLQLYKYIKSVNNELPCMNIYSTRCFLFKYLTFLMPQRRAKINVDHQPERAAHSWLHMNLWINW